MTSNLRSLVGLAPALSRQRATRLLSGTSVVRNEAAPALGTLPPQRKPIGGFRGGIVGFLFGFSLAASFAAYNLLDEYKQASAALQTSVEDLRLSTEQVTAHIKRIEAVEKDLRALTEASATREDISRVRTEMKQLYNTLHVEFLELKTHVWGMQQDLHSLSKKEATTVRI